MVTRSIVIGVCAVVLCCVAAGGERGEQPLFDMGEILDASTLEVEVAEDWHAVRGEVGTRQKLITIRVGELWPGQDYRVPVRMIVPADRKAKGFHLTGGHVPGAIRRDAQIRGVERELIVGGVGLVYTVVQNPEMSGQGELGREMYRRFIETLDPHYSIQYWGWPASLMRAATAAYAEEGHFEKGKIALSGGSKNGASPSVAIIADKRMTGLHATVSPIWESPLRLCDEAAWEKLNEYNRRAGVRSRHAFLGGTFGPIYNADALEEGHSWEDIRELAVRLADDIFISRNIEQLKARGVDLYFHPGTHDFVAFDISWGGRNYPQIPVYLRANSGHGKGRGHEASERGEQNKAAFLLQHFFKGVEPMPEAPSVGYDVQGDRLSVAVRFRSGAKVESGRVWWMYDRGPDGSEAYIGDMFGKDEWKDMKYDAGKDAWVAEIELEAKASHVDFFSNHRKTICYRSRNYPTYISSPYTRVMIRDVGEE